jgi:hypothetical protein
MVIQINDLVSNEEKWSMRIAYVHSNALDTFLIRASLVRSAKKKIITITIWPYCYDPNKHGRKAD